MQLSYLIFLKKNIFVARIHFSAKKICWFPCEEKLEIFRLLQSKGIVEGLVTFEHMFAGYEASLEILKKCGLEMLQYTE